jgi:hypothetical protein
MYVYKTYNPSEPVRKVRYWATKESRQDYLRYPHSGAMARAMISPLIARIVRRSLV